ncbi:MAG: type 4a pilus biogenesis protein PilO [bacterium]
MPINKEVLIKLPVWKKALILAGVMIVLGLAWYMLFFLPNDEEISSLRSQLDKLQKQIQEQQKAKEAKLDLEKQIKALEAELRVLSSRLPEEKEIPDLLSSVNETGRLHGLEFVLFKQGKPVRKEYYSEIPVEIQVRGGFHQIMQFLSKVGELDRIVHVSKLKMGQYKGEPGGGTILATLQATTYKYESEPPPKKVEPGKKPSTPPPPAKAAPKGGKGAVD